MKTLKDLRIEKGLTQQQVADMADISLRSYKMYENDEAKVDTIKYRYLMDLLMKVNPIDEEHGVVDLAYIQKKCEAVFEKHPVTYCYLFGSYAKGKAKPESDIDLLVSAEVTGLKFYALVEELRTNLHKKVDVLDINQLKNNFELTQEILRDGKKIYG